MIESIHTDHLVARCAMCEEARDIPLGDLAVQGIDATTAAVALPACPCGAVELLIRVARGEHPEPGSLGHRHRLLVDHLHAELVGRTRTTAAQNSADAHRLCPPVLPDVLARWFPQGLCLHEPTEPEPAS